MRAVVLGCEGPSLSPDERRFFRDADPYGFILFRRNCDDPEQVRRLVSDLRDSVGRDAPVLIDQEGGRVIRMRAPHWYEGPAPAVFGALHRRDPGRARRAARLNAAAIAADLATAGIDVNCVPSLDLRYPTGHEVIGDRAFAGEPEVVIDLGRAVCVGSRDAGVLPVPKHMPGHGRATVDSHDSLPSVEASRDELSASDFLPFRAFAGETLGMTGHLLYRGIDPDRPATLSPTVIREIIRTEIGFDGLLLTDDISMRALRGPLGSLGAEALAAGCDVVLHCNGAMDEMRDVVAEAGMLEGEALARADRAIRERDAVRQNARGDQAGMLRELEELLAKAPA